MSRFGTDHDPRRERRSERGTAIIPILAMVIVLVAAGSAALLTGHNHHKSIKVNERSMRALEIVEAGMAFATQELTQNADLDKDGSVGNATGAFGGGNYSLVSTDLGGGEYRVRGWGEFEDVRRTLEIVVGGTGSASYYPNGLVGRSGVTMSAQVTLDSYDSTKSYLSQMTNLDHKGLFANGNAIVMSNGSISAGATIVLRGSVVPGPDEFFNNHRRTYLSGTEEAMKTPASIPDPPKKQFEWAYANNKNESWTVLAGKAPTYDPVTKSLSMSSKTTLQLKPGVYFFSDIKMTGKAGLVVSDKTKLYVTGNVDLSGGSVTNLSGRPGNLELIAHPYSIGKASTTANPQMKLTGGAKVAMAIYAPGYDVSANGSGSFYGAIVGKTLSLQGVDMHYDETLAKEGTAVIEEMPSSFERRSWKDSSTIGY